MSTLPQTLGTLRTDLPLEQDNNKLRKGPHMYG